MYGVWRALGLHTQMNVAAGALADLVRTRRDLMLENAMLRHQIVILRRKSRELAVRDAGPGGDAASMGPSAVADGEGSRRNRSH